MLSLPDPLIKSEDMFDPPIKLENAIHSKQPSGFPLEFIPVKTEAGMTAIGN